LSQRLFCKRELVAGSLYYLYQIGWPRGSLDFKPMEIRSEVTVTVSALVAGLVKYASEEHWPIKSEPRWSEISGGVFVTCSTCVHCIVVLTNGFAQFFA